MICGGKDGICCGLTGPSKAGIIQTVQRLAALDFLDRNGVNAMIKRLSALFLALAMLLSLAACGKQAMGAVGFVTGQASGQSVTEDGSYNSKEEVAQYLHLYGHLPGNYVSKQEAQQLGWSGGSVEPYAGEGTAIGGSSFGNYEERLPEAKGRSYHECDIDTVGEDSRGAKRLVYSNDGLIYYTEDHYESFDLLYGEP